MKNIKMDKTKTSASQSPTSEDQERPSKRQKTTPNSNDSALESDLDCGRASKRCDFIRSELSAIAAVERSLEEERNSLKLQKQSLQEELAKLQEDLEKYKKNTQQLQDDLDRSERDKQQLQENLERSRKAAEEAVAQLQGDLNTSMRDIEEARKSKNSAESKLFQLKTIIQEHITPLIENPNFISPLAASQSQEELQESVPEALVEVTLSSGSASQEEVNPQDLSLPNTIPSVQTTPEDPSNEETVKEKGAGEPQEELQAERNRISPEKEEESQEKDDEPLQVKILEKKCEILSPEGRGDDSVHSSGPGDEVVDDSSSGGDVEMIDLSDETLPMIPPDHSSTLADQDEDKTLEAVSDVSGEECSPSDDEPEEEVFVMSEGSSPLDSTGKKYPVRVDSGFFKINWNAEYTRTGKDTFECKTCQYFSNSVEFIEDHVWSGHYNGIFQCPQCIELPGYSAVWRRSVREHIKKKHCDL